MILHGDYLDRLKELPDNSVDAVVTDPPYGLKFMGKKWDHQVPSIEIWKQALRVLKPGGHLLSFGGTRTYHRMVVNIEDAGFEIRDQIQWLYGSGFPKSLDVSKAIDKAAGAERELVGANPNNRDRSKHRYNSVGDLGSNAKITAPSTASAKQWQGWGTALKPANEPICMARKPLEKGLTVAENVQKWGTGALNIDASRTRLDPNDPVDNNAIKQWARQQRSGVKIFNQEGNAKLTRPELTAPTGRWPANVILDEEAAAGHDWSRFFYVAKASKSERGDGNRHPTVKPLKLMEYLIRMVTPPTGIVLDPFAGSGSTLVAAKRLGFGCIGIEREAEYVEIASKRLEAVA